MFPQRHNYSSSCSGLDQMLQLPSAHMPMPLPTPVDRSTNSSRWKPNIEVAPNCPRCASTNTKFCYYNNYSLSQPRYFCKGCRRYWTKGGSLRNVPVGGGCRKNRRGKSMRHPQTECLSMNGNSGASDDRNSSVGDDQARVNIGSRDIDMALVFAKYLNQNVSAGEEFESDGNNMSSSSTNNLSNSLTPESAETENDAVLQPQKPFDPITHFDAVLLGSGAPEEEMVHNFVGEDQLSLSGIELGGLMGVGVDGDNDDVVHDVLWSDAPMSSSVTWQPPMMQMQLQEMEYSMSMPLNEESQLLPVGSTMNLMSDSWSTWNSFDFSTMEVSSHQDLNHQL